MIKIIGITFSVLTVTAAQAKHPSWPAPMHETYVGQVMIDRLELQRQNGETSANWDITGWYGGDYHRLVWRFEGENTINDGNSSHVERNDLSYSYLLSPFWSVQAGLGVRQSMSGHNKEHYGVLSLNGLAPYWFEVDSSVVINEAGQVQWLNEVEYDVLLTQSSYLQPRITTTINVAKSTEFARPKGLEQLRIGLRYRHEITREIAPYIGGYWQREKSVDNHYTTETGLVAGVRLWF
ncbi:copper resistance protein B [Alteromonas sp. C1M14]|uniref:copper resistance protein B n=1 Tax=Alteromonas sp. C1M14 TaxID=2841567 RepID=UPI001C09B9E6|nr:copper resistance protein B [Alteromonas sp. C1M14]MBU2980098.1 copper resistance protein B [Alteromonas sp. C1M14]